MEITRTTQYFEIIFEYRPAITKDLQELKTKGARWNPRLNDGKGGWTLPLSCEKEAAALKEKYYKPPTETQTMQEIVYAIPPMPELETDIPLLVKPYHYQKQGMSFIIKNKKVLVGDDMGTGKTMQAIGAVVGSNRKCTLVICPNAVKQSWQDSFKRFADWKSVIMQPKIKSTWLNFHTIANIKVFIVNYESLKTFFVSKINVDAKGNYKSSDIELVEAAKAFDCIIWDESHKCKEPTAQVSKICMALAMGREYRICMTGTAVVNKPKDLFTQLCIIGQLGNLFKERKYFFERYCGGYSGRGGTNLKELQSILKNTCYYRRNKSEVWQEMPAITRTVVKCEITNRQKYKDCQNDLKTYLETVGKSAKEVQRSMRAEIMVRFMKLLSIAAKGKLESVYEILSEAIENEQKYVLFADSRDVIASVFDKFKKHATFINGLLSQEQREVNKTKFLTDPECFIFVVSLKVGGTGMDGLQHVCSRGGFIQFPWHPAMSDQAEARLHRTGQKESVGFDYFLGVDTVDERVWDIIESKRGVSMQVLGSEDAAEVDTVDMINSLFDIRKNRD